MRISFLRGAVPDVSRRQFQIDTSDLQLSTRIFLTSPHPHLASTHPKNPLTSSIYSGTVPLRYRPLPKEGAFAASGTSIAICDRGDNIYFGTGGGSVARVFHSGDGGHSWSAADTPIATGNPSSGIFSVACGDFLVVAVGGDYKEPAAAKRAATYSKDSGATWHLAEQQPGGYRSAVGEIGYGDFAAVGPNGTDVSQGNGGESMHWQHTDLLNLNAASFDGQEGWAVGPKGTIARFKTHFLYQIKNNAPTLVPLPGQ